MQQENNLSAGRTLKFDFMTSLKNIAAVNITARLWMNQSTQKQLATFFHSNIKREEKNYRHKWKIIEFGVRYRIPRLGLPEPLPNLLESLVPLVGNFIVQWIKYHDDYVFNTTQYSQLSAVDQINNIKWTVRGRINYEETAKNILAKQDSCLSDVQKYKLACAYCLRNEICANFPKIDLYTLHRIRIDKHPMVLFWTAVIERDNSILNKALYSDDDNRRTRNMSMKQHIFKLLMNNNMSVKRTLNVVPIQFMLSTLNKEEKAQNIKSLVVALGDQDFLYSLLSILDYEQQQMVLKEYSSVILEGMFNDWLWTRYFLPTARYALRVMNIDSYLHILKIIIKNIDKSQENKDIFQELWKEAPKHFKDVIFEHKYARSLHEFVVNSLILEQNKDIMKLMLNDLNAEQKKIIIFGDFAIEYSADLLEQDRRHLLDRLMGTLSSEEDAWEFKRRVIKTHKVTGKVGSHLERNNYNEAEDIIKWAMKPEAAIEFREGFAYFILETFLKPVPDMHELDLKDLDNFFDWCTTGNQKSSRKLRVHVPRIDVGVDLIFDLIAKEKYNLLDQFLNWCFVSNQQDISQFKSEIYKIDKGLKLFKSRFCDVIEDDHSFKLADKFVDWAFTSSQEKQEFKYWLLYSHERSFSVCSDFLCNSQFELADKFMKWCVPSFEEMNSLKNDLMLSSEMNNILAKVKESDLQFLIKWFNPSKITITEFKKRFPKNKCPENFYKLLDEFVKAGDLA